MAINEIEKRMGETCWAANLELEYETLEKLLEG